MNIPIFVDFGGTIGDSLGITRKVFKEIFNKELTNEQIKEFFIDRKKHNRQSMYLFFKYPVNPIKLILKRKTVRKRHRELFITDVELFPDIKKTFEKIKEVEGIDLVLVTRNPTFEDKKLADKTLKRLFDGYNPFKMVLSSEDKYEIIETNFEPEQIQKGAMIGDSADDAYVAQLLNIPFYGVAWGYTRPSELETPFIAYEPIDLYHTIKDHVKDIEEDTLNAKSEYKELDIDFDFDEEFDK